MEANIRKAMVLLFKRLSLRHDILFSSVDVGLLSSQQIGLESMAQSYSMMLTDSGANIRAALIRCSSGQNMRIACSSTLVVIVHKFLQKMVTNCWKELHDDLNLTFDMSLLLNGSFENRGDFNGHGQIGCWSSLGAPTDAVHWMLWKHESNQQPPLLILVRERLKLQIFAQHLCLYCSDKNPPVTFRAKLLKVACCCSAEDLSGERSLSKKPRIFLHHLATSWQSNNTIYITKSSKGEKLILRKHGALHDSMGSAMYPCSHKVVHNRQSKSGI